MPQQQPIVQAIEELRAELPGLCGSQWPAISAGLAALEQEITADAIEPRLARATALSLFAQAPAAHRRFLPLLQSLETSYVPTLMRDLPRQAFAVIPGTMTVAEAQSRLRHGQTIVVTAPDGRPRGILLEAQAKLLDDPAQTMQHYATHFLLPVLTTFDTRLADIARGIEYERALRWHVILRGSTVAGLVAPQDLLDTLQRLPGDEELSSIETKGITGNLAGDPVSPPSALCYRCQSDPSHHVSPSQVQQRDVLGNALCPFDSSVMIAENPCRTGV